MHLGLVVAKLNLSQEAIFLEKLKLFLSIFGALQKSFLTQYPTAAAVNYKM